MASSQAVGLREVREATLGSELQRPASLSAARPTVSFLRRHWLFLMFLLGGTGLRVLVTLAYWPALELRTDSYDYLTVARTLRPGPWHPAGYSLFLRALSPVGNLGVVPIVQHLLGLGVGALLYALLLRLGARPWLAALGALPVLLDGFQLDIEQFVLAETLTEVLLVGGMAVLLWRRKLTAPFAATAGVLLALVAVTRDAALPLVVVVGVYLLVRRWWRALLSFGAAAAVILVVYGFWSGSFSGHFGRQGFGGHYLYGRVAPFATCRYPLPADEAKLCPPQPVGERPYNQDYYAWLPGSPINQRSLGSMVTTSKLGQRFAEQVILHQPFAYLDAVWRDTWHYFTPGRWVVPNGDVMTLRRWQFPGPHLNPYAGVKVNDDLYQLDIFFANVGFNHRPVTDRVHPAFMGPLQTYQSFAYTQGPLLLASLVSALAVSLPLWRANARRRRTRWAALLLAVSGLVLAVIPSATVGFSYRYQLPLLVLLPPAGILAADVAADAAGRIRERSGSARLSQSRPLTPGTANAPDAVPTRP
jgi:hypothetical protein